AACVATQYGCRHRTRASAGEAWRAGAVPAPGRDDGLYVRPAMPGPCRRARDDIPSPMSSPFGYFGPGAPLEAAAFALMRRAGGDDLVAQRIQTFNRASVQLLGRAREAIAAGDAAEVQSALHSLQSRSAQVGAHSLASLSAAGARL